LELVNLTNNQELANEIYKAHTFLTRLKGLMFSKELPLGCGLHIKPCRSVHTYFMNYAIDVLFVNDRLEIVGIVESMSPRKVSKVYHASNSVIELPAGTARRTGTEIGHELKFKN
jgi:uncharacterized membrane protein (UPF0127 family)